MERQSKLTEDLPLRHLFNSFSVAYNHELIMSSLRSAFFHKRSFGGLDEPYVGQAVSFVFGEGPKGAAATKVEPEEGPHAVEDEREREMGTIQVRLSPP